MLTYVYLFLQSLVFSAITEAVTVGAVLSFLKKEAVRKAAVVAVCGTVLTIPYVWFVFPTLLYFSPLGIIAVGELFAVIAEGLLYAYVCNYPLRFAFFLSLVANLASYGLGQLVW